MDEIFKNKLLKKLDRAEDYGRVYHDSFITAHNLLLEIRDMIDIDYFKKIRNIKFKDKRKKISC